MTEPSRTDPLSTDSDRPDVLVLRQKPHGMAHTAYADLLVERLPDLDIRVARTPAEERRLIEHAPIVSAGSLRESLLDHAQNLQWFAGMYAGYEHLPLEHLEEMDVTVTNAAGVHGPNIAEHVVGAMLTFTRGFLTARDRQRRHEWRSFQTRELAASTVTIVGLGAIGTTIADRLDPFDVNTRGVRYTPEKGGPTDEVYGFEDLHDALVDAEYVAVATPLTEDTRGLIGHEELKTMPSEAVLINVARGPVVDTDALVGAIQANHIRGAQLDVTDPEPLPQDHPLWDFENVLITPHNAGHTPEYYDRLADIVTENVRTIRETGDFTALENQVLP